jgi:hypothetical protein
MLTGGKESDRRMLACFAAAWIAGSKPGNDEGEISLVPARSEWRITLR